MHVVLMVFALASLLELGLHLPLLWRLRNSMAFSAVFVLAFGSAALLVGRFTFWAIVITLLSAYRILNCFRILEDRMYEGYLRRATLRTSLALMLLQLAAVGAWLLWDAWIWYHTVDPVWTFVAAVQCVAALVLLGSMLRRLKRTAWQTGKKMPSDSLPTLTVAIPARNETDDLQLCLESLIASDYPKLEVLVLDDCSQTTRTPEIIKAFAHDGVRFIKGDPPKPTWLAKNQAYEHLAREASGELILFCGVDVRFGPTSLRQMVVTMLTKKKRMLCVLPQRAAGAERQFAVVQAMRYFWELAPPRRLFGRPPVLSTCWLIERKALFETGGFAAVTRSIVPEAHFARELARKDFYSFLRANEQLGIESTKPAREQWQTAIRMRYPQLHRRPESVLIVSVWYAFALLGPFVLLTLSIWVHIGAATLLFATLGAIILVTVYSNVVQATRTGNVAIGVITFPFAVLLDIYLAHASMMQYEFSVVDWKGRNVCVPTMRVIPHLPKLD